MRRKQSLSANACPDGTHETLGALDSGFVEVVHRLVHDVHRITQTWVQDCGLVALDDGEYVETVAVTATVLALDGFAKALGQPLLAIPDAIPGAPSRTRPANAKLQLGWVPTLNPGEHEPGETDPYTAVSGVHIHQALSLVPDEVVAFFELDAAQYLPDAALRDYGNEYRALTHPQIELLAARVSAINQCVY